MANKKNIFIVEDDLGMHTAYKEILAHNYSLHFYQTPDSFLKMTGNFKPDLVIIDIGLGEMDGYELCEKFKDMDDVMESVPVVFVTGRDFDLDEGRAFFSGGAEYVTKPIEADSFCLLIEGLIH